MSYKTTAQLSKSLPRCSCLACCPSSRLLVVSVVPLVDVFTHVACSCPHSSLVWNSPRAFFVFRELGTFGAYKSVTSEMPLCWVCLSDAPHEDVQPAHLVGMVGKWPPDPSDFGGVHCDQSVKVVSAQSFRCKVAVSFCNESIRLDWGWTWGSGR